jgi:hypothetical protein
MRQRQGRSAGSGDQWLDMALDLPSLGDVEMVLHGVVALLRSREFAANFVGNLGGAMGGVLLAFWIERIRARREARMLYGRILRTSRSELAYLKPMCEHRRDTLRASRSAGTLDSFGVPATRAVLISPLVHDQAPYSLIMALTILCGCLDGTENAFREARQLKLQDVVARELLNKTLGDELDKASTIITIALEQIDSQLNLLGLEKTPDAMTQEVSRRLLEVLRSSQGSVTGQNRQANQSGDETP